MVQQTTECAWFIRDYMKLKEFCEPHKIISLFSLYIDNHEGKWMARSIASSPKHQVEKFKSKFVQLRFTFQADGVVEIEIAVLRVVDDVQSVKKDLSDLAI